MRVDVENDSLWTSVEADASSLRQGEETEACIVGAGVAGLSVAYRLVQCGRRVLVLDDGPIGGGQTGRTTAHLASAIDDRFVALERIRGRANARLAAESHAS